MTPKSLRFGTSGLRGLAADLEGAEASRFTAAFLRHARNLGHLGEGRVFLGRDLRRSSPSIASDCAAAVVQLGLEAIDCGAIPTPALALHAMSAGCPAIMVTGSHIPAERNGLKFYLPGGEITKTDEAGILAALGEDFGPAPSVELGDEADAAFARYIARFSRLLPRGALQGWRIGVFEHTTVSRDALTAVLRQAGAETFSLGRADGFVALDTEALSAPLLQPLGGWLKQERVDLIVSADGDGDRPLLMDGRGGFVRGDVLGLLAAKYLGARTVVTPVTSNSGIEGLGLFDKVVRTKVGSPYVIDAMRAEDNVVGFEANGGTLVGSGIMVGGRPLSALPTRDAILPLLCVLGLAAAEGRRVEDVVAALSLPYTASDRLQDVDQARSVAFIERLVTDSKFREVVSGQHGLASYSSLDGIRMCLVSGDIVHFRASGNAPELRCYVESRSEDGARRLLSWAMEVARNAVSAKCE